jgi:plasmid stability protein
MSRRLTIRGVPDEVAAALERASRERGMSVNATVNQILAAAMSQGSPSSV